MENLIQYLDDSLVPLEKKVKEYLDVERQIRLLEVKVLTQDKSGQDTEAPDKDLQEKQQQLQQLLQQYEQLKKEVVQMLPEQNKFIEIDLGYGPSMVGYFTADHETHQPLPEPVLRVVH